MQKKWKERVVSLLTVRMREEKNEKEGRKRNRRTRARLGEIWKMAFSPFAIGSRTGYVSTLQQESQVKESRWVEEIPQRWNQPKGEDRTAMIKEAALLRCTVLSGSAWSTERKYRRRYKGKCDIFFGIEHRLRKVEMEK